MKQTDSVNINNIWTNWFKQGKRNTDFDNYSSQVAAFDWLVFLYSEAFYRSMEGL